MRLEAITLVNWLPFGGEHRLDLPAGPIAVTAAWEENPYRSNWAGKSAFLEAIEWILFDTHRKRYDDDVITDGEDFVSGRLRFSGGVEILRVRNRGKSTVAEFWEGSTCHRKKAAEERIADFLRYDLADYRATAYFKQDDIAAIVSKENATRRRIVAEWLELDPWLRVAARARAHARETAAKWRTLAAEVNARAVSLEQGPGPIDTAKDIGASRGAYFLARELAEEVESRLEAVAEREIVRQNAARLRDVTARIADLRAKLAGTGIPVETIDAARAVTFKAQEAEESARAEVDEARRLARGEFDGTCPVTACPCPVADEIRTNTDAGRLRLKKARETAAAATEAAAGARAELRGLIDKAKEIARLREDYNAAVGEAKRLRQTLPEELGPELTDEEVTRLRFDRDRLRAEERKHFAEYQAALEEERERAADEAWIDAKNEEVEALTVEAEAAALALTAVGPAGIPAAIAEASLGALEERANNSVLAGLGLRFTLGWDREVKDLAPSCDECGYIYKGQKDKSCPSCGTHRPKKRSDELEILTDDGSGVVEDIRAKSGGAQVLVASAIRLAARRLLCERRGSPIAWAVVDEPFGALDRENRVALARVFLGMLGAMGLEQAFVVSHDAALLSAFPHRIEIIRKRDGRSTLAVI